MRKAWIYGLLLAAALAVPTQTVKLGQMRPVETVYLYKRGNVVVIATDTKDQGVGSTASEALDNLKETASGIIYLDTAKYLLIGKDAEDQILQIGEKLKPDTYLCGVVGNVDLTEASSYLNVHRPRVTLRRWNEKTKLQTLVFERDMKKLQ